jgi:replicative DNA helicase
MGRDVEKRSKRDTLGFDPRLWTRHNETIHIYYLCAAMSSVPLAPSLYHPEIEQALLSIVLRDNHALENLPDTFSFAHFYDPLHQRIFKAIAHFVQKGHLASPITLAQFFKTQDQSDREAQYLVELAGIILPSRNVRDYAEHVFQDYLRRQLVDLGQSLVQEVQTISLEGPTPMQHIETLEHRLFNLTQWGVERGPQAFSHALGQAIDMAEAAYKREGHVVGVSTGFVDMDKLLGGLHPSDLIILAGRPSMGKTALATNIAFNAAVSQLNKPDQEGAAVAFFSLEMSSNQLAMRLLGQETGIPSDRIRRGAIEKSHFPAFVEISRQLHGLPLFIDDTPALSIAGLLTRARRLKRKENIGLIVIDYLQLLTTGRSSGDNRVQELSEITRGLKAMAKELNVPVLALSQLSRAVEQRDDKHPQLADLRESGTIEQDADVVMFVYREEYYESRKKPAEGSDKMAMWQKNMAGIYNVAEVIIAKQRHGPIATVSLHFDGQRTKFSNLTKT